MTWLYPTPILPKGKLRRIVKLGEPDEVQEAQRQRNVFMTTQWKLRNPERVKASNEKAIEKNRKRAAEWRKNNKERYLAYMRKYNKTPKRQQYLKRYYLEVAKPKKAA